jgi:hypothetical protein
MRARLVRSENVWMRIPMLADTIHRLKWLIASAPPSKAFVTGRSIGRWRPRLTAHHQ